MISSKLKLPVFVHPNIPLISLFNFCLDFKLFAPIAILYFAQVSGSFALGMSVFSVVFLSAALFEVPTGVFSDLIGRKRTSVIGALFSLLGVVTYAVAGNYWILLLGAVLEGISRSFFSGNDEALLYESLEEVHLEKDYAHYLGKTSSMFQVALSIAALLGGFLAIQSLRIPVMLSIIPQVVMVLVALALINPKPHIVETTNVFAHLIGALKLFMSNSKLRLLSFNSMLSFSVSESMYLFRNAFVALLWPVWAIGILNTIGNAGAAVSYFFSGPVLKRVKPLSFLIGSSLYARLINFMALIFPTILSPALLATTSLSHGSADVARSTLLQEHFSKEKRSTMGSLSSFGGSLLFAVMSLVIGAAADQWGPIGALILGNILLLPITPIYWYLFAKDKRVDNHA